VRSYSYYVAKLFATNYGTETVAVTGDSVYGPLYWAATKNDAGTYFVKIVNYGGFDSTPVTVAIPGKTNNATLITVSGPDTYSTNTPGNITSVWTETTVRSSSGGYSFILNGSYINAVLVA
jgi:alpha-L-arabinofuranosidase